VCRTHHAVCRNAPRFLRKRPAFSARFGYHQPAQGWLDVCFGAARALMHFSSFVAVAVAVLGLSFAAESRAEPHERTGFYLQISMGLGRPSFSGTAVDSAVAPPIQFADNDWGLSLTGSVLAGGALQPGLVFGAGVLSAVAFNGAPKRTRDGQPDYVEDDGGPYLDAFALAGPFVDYYPIATSGFHLQVLAGPAAHGRSDLGGGAPSGFGLMGGVGYDAWASDKWSVGVLGRVTYTNTTESVTFAERDIMIAPSLEISATFF
jgi:hypothetical protein